MMPFDGLSRIETKIVTITPSDQLDSVKHGTRNLAFVEEPDGYKVELNESLWQSD